MTNLSTIIKFSKLLEENHRTYNDVEEILTQLLEHYRTKRKHAEMTTREGVTINAGSYLVNKI